MFGVEDEFSRSDRGAGKSGAREESFHAIFPLVLEDLQGGFVADSCLVESVKF
jgi:hypothetical protein